MISDGAKYLIKHINCKTVCELSEEIRQWVGIYNAGTAPQQQTLDVTLKGADGSAEDEGQAPIDHDPEELRTYEVSSTAQRVGKKTLEYETEDSTSSIHIRVVSSS